MHTYIMHIRIHTHHTQAESVHKDRTAKSSSNFTIKQYLLQMLLILEESNTGAISDVTRKAKVCLFHGNPNTSQVY